MPSKCKHGRVGRCGDCEVGNPAAWEPKKIGGYNVSLDLDLKGDAARIERSKDCESRGYHRPMRPPQTQQMSAGPGVKIMAELCRDCGVWIGPGHYWDSPEEVDAAHS